MILKEFDNDLYGFGDDNEISTPGVTTVVTDGVDTGDYAALGSDSSVDFSFGNDQAIGYGAFLVFTPPVPPQEPIESEFTFSGLSVTGDLLMTGLKFPVGGLPQDDDTVIGFSSVVRDEGAVAFIQADGIRIAKGDLITGLGNDIVLGAALGVNADAVRGVNSENISTGDGEDIVVGAAINIQTGAEERSSVNGIFAQRIETGAGSDIVAGVGLATVDSGQAVNLSGISAVDVYTAGESDTPADEEVLPEDSIILGVAGIVGADGIVADNALARGSGIAINIIETGLGNDIVVGVYVATFGTDSFVENVEGIALGRASLSDGLNLLAGVVYAELGGGNEEGFNDNSGILFSTIEGGGDSDTILGVVWAEMADSSTSGGNAGLLSFPDVREPFSIVTFGGEDSVIGIGEVVSANDDGGEAKGIVDVSMDLGSENDFVVGVGSSSVSTSSFRDGSYGIYNSGEGLLQIKLGAGDDFVYARGADNGIVGMEFRGDSGNDVFDIQGGTGEIYGGDDIDTLVLFGAVEDFLIKVFVVEDSDGTEIDNLSSVTFEAHGGQLAETDLEVFGVEWFEFRIGEAIEIISFQQLAFDYGGH